MAEPNRNNTHEPVEGAAKRPDEAAHPEPKGVSDGDRPTIKEPTEARQGQTIRGGLIRRIMLISIALVVVAFALLYLLYFGAPGE